MPVILHRHKPRRAASEKRVKDNAALRAACKDAPLRQLRGISRKMLPLIRHCVDQPHIPAVPDRGNVWWPGWSFCRNVCNIFDNLKNNYQRYPALIPAYSFLDDKAPSPVADIHKNGRLIEWEQRKSNARDPMQKALFYAVYCFPDGVPVNIDDSRYLLKITQDTSYNVVAENKEHGAGCKYVVTVIDRCWNESRASRIIWY